MNLLRDATARPVITSKRPLIRSILAHCTVAGSDNAATTPRKNSARSRRGSTKVTGPSARHAITIPGKPAPEPTSTQDAPVRGSKRMS